MSDQKSACTSRTFLCWTADMSVGVREFDQQHQKLIDLVNELHEAMGAGKGKDALGSILGALIDYTKTHFAAEERHLQATNYPGYLKHLGEHKGLTSKVVELQAQHAAGKMVLTTDVMSFLRDWLKTHIMGSDKLYSSYLKARGIH